MKIIWLASAENDLAALIDYISEDNPQTALDIFTTIRDTVGRLALYPYAGREGRVKRTRELVVPRLPYIVVYVVASEIRILALIHSSRKWPPTA